MHSSHPADGLADAQQQLVEIREDRRIKHFALRLAGDVEVAADALQSAYYAIARLNNLEQIENLRAYFCKVLIRAVHRERSQLGAALVEDFVYVAEVRQDAVSCHPASPPQPADAACISLQARAWLELFAAQRGRLLAAVPVRSNDATRYRMVIYAAAEQVLRDAINAEPSEADTNDALRAAYPAYFNQPGVAVNTCHQRFRRAREDVRALLQEVVNRDELT
jgi:DNA-directed RNA polymerase specialized sigma24 family protein